jgi:hypothetical protein
MSFTYVPASKLTASRAGFSPDILGSVLGGYKGAVQAKYMPREKEAEIFHKQISPLAMLASSPYFSSLHPEQQQQMAAYISQMLSRQGLGSQGGMSGQSGQMPQGGQMGQPQQPGSMQGINGLAPKNPAEHFTGKFTQSPYSPGTVHRGEQGESIYAPTGTNVQKGLDVLTESKGLEKLFNEYSKLAPKVGGAGGARRELSKLASGIGKTGLPYAQQVSEFLGGDKLSNEAAKARALKAQMAPALRSLGYSNQEIEDILNANPGENEKNIADRLKMTWPVIQRKIALQKKNLEQGINVSANEPESLEQKVMKANNRKTSAKQAKHQNNYDMAPPGSIGLYRNGELYYIPQKELNNALAAGFSYE